MPGWRRWVCIATAMEMARLAALDLAGLAALDLHCICDSFDAPDSIRHLM